eukprot:605724-Pelagomonas_calceolata.AAC.2
MASSFSGPPDTTSLNLSAQTHLLRMVCQVFLVALHARKRGRPPHIAGISSAHAALAAVLAAALITRAAHIAAAAAAAAAA